MKHYPVMLPEVLQALNMQSGETCVDGTFGNGGYSQAILDGADCNVIGLDRDPCLLYTSPSPRDQRGSRMPSSA